MAPSNLRVLPEPSSNPGLLDYLSASRLKCWQTCRRQFFFRYVERIATPTAPALFIGQQVHECLKSLNWARWKSEPFDADQRRAEFDESWKRGLESESAPWKKEGDEANAKAQAWAMLETYFAESPVPYSETPEGVEVEVDCHLDRFGIRLVGIIDLVRHGGKIVDYKTAARTPSSGSGPEQHATQLASYATLYRRATGQTESGFELHYLIKTKQPKILVSSLDPMSDRLEAEFFRLIEDYLEGIANKSWLTSPNQHCSWCPFTRECRKMSGL
ncbi:MAG: PD-(D/E)XK nuclease family protein [Verrucomicrobiales bacterium]|nr:PD-(D/E)XK nuclease family protein [Verrucomicrobiales bacterium]